LLVEQLQKLEEAAKGQLLSGCIMTIMVTADPEDASITFTSCAYYSTAITTNSYSAFALLLG
jgi:hypothetical protein